jgi:hypothetical protein
MSCWYMATFMVGKLVGRDETKAMTSKDGEMSDPHPDNSGASGLRFGILFNYRIEHSSAVRWCSWLSRSPHIQLIAKGPEFEPRLNHYFFVQVSGYTYGSCSMASQLF